MEPDVVKVVRVEIVNRSCKALTLKSTVPMSKTNAKDLTESDQGEWTMTEHLWRKHPSVLLRPLCSTTFSLESPKWSDLTGHVKYVSEHSGEKLDFQFFWNVTSLEESNTGAVPNRANSLSPEEWTVSTQDGVSCWGSSFAGQINLYKVQFTILWDSWEDVPTIKDIVNSRMRNPQAKSIVKKLKEYPSTWVQTQIDQQNSLQNFCSEISEEFKCLEIWKHSGDAEIEGLEDYIEDYIMSHTWKQAFLTTTEDLLKDEKISKKLNVYNFITFSHLEIPEFKNEKLLNSAIKCLRSLNSYHTPSQKISLILETCKSLYGIIRSSKTEGGADDLLPLLIYSIIHANPPNIFSNITYPHFSYFSLPFPFLFLLSLLLFTFP
eukprot:TRINITY_DN3652_c0_g1_i1.p1 TRINITY_DN3652_c0_g1~~TRINITY_DN3652_c0_g1_i1.p1  ORF type:complete len:378 (+),score=65.97 TRINITY_DN3652_c0_g1_i1:1-1134(+)